MDKELKNWLSYPRWKMIHDKLIDSVFAKGDTNNEKDPFDLLDEGLCLTVKEGSYSSLKEGLDNYKSYGKKSIEEFLNYYTTPLGQDSFLYEVKYDAWNCNLIFRVIKLVGENKGGYVFKSYNEVEFYDYYGMYGALQAVKMVR